MMNRTLFHQLIRVRTFTNRLSPMVSVVFTILCFASTLSIAQPNRTVDSMESSPRVGTNLSGITDWSSSFPFVDLFKSSRNWISGNTDGRWSDGRTVAMDEHGWVTSLLPNQIARGILLADEMPLFMSGTFLVLYEGNGTIVYQGSARLIPGESQPGRHVIQIDAQAGNTWLEILQTDASNYIRNIQIVRPEYEHNAKSVIFNPDFIASLQNMKALRFMDWARTNSSTLTQWADRPKVADARWSSDFGVPLEIMILLANRIDADPWFCIPHLANDRYVKLAAAMVDDQVEPGRTLYVEHSNEVWNSIFPQAIYARQQGIARHREKGTVRGWPAGVGKIP